jgi:hypothetical protein
MVLVDTSPARMHKSRRYSRGIYPRGSASRFEPTQPRFALQTRIAGSNQGHVALNVLYSCVLVGCHLRRKVFEFAVSHEPHKPRVGYLRSIASKIVDRK